MSDMALEDDDLRDEATLESGADWSVNLFPNKGELTYIRYLQRRKEERPLRKNCIAEIMLKMQS